MQTASLELTPRELTLIRVAMLQRLSRLQTREDMAESYDETKALLNGKLWECREQLAPKQGA